MKVLWQAWYGDREIELDFPATWRVQKVQMADAAPAHPDSLAESLRQPIGAPALQELAGASTQAAIAVEDITRPSPLGHIASLVIDELQAGGLKPENIRFIIGLGAHTPMRREELILKLGRSVVEGFPIYQNQPHENRKYLGETQRGTPIYTNAFFWEADLRLSIGTIVPHSHAGFAGVRFARKVYSTRFPPPADIAVFNAYPKDTDLVQVLNSMNAVARDLRRAIKPDGSAVLATACTHGPGIHYLLSSGMRAHGPLKRERIHLGKNGLIIFSPNLSYADIEEFPQDTCLFNSWPEVIAELGRRHGDQATVSVFPNAALQIPEEIALLED